VKCIISILKYLRKYGKKEPVKMTKYEISLSIKDESGFRKKEGDIFSVIPYPGHWGRKILDGWLIVIVETKATLERLQVMGRMSVYRERATGKLFDTNHVNEVTDELTGGTQTPDDFELLYKRRYAISLADLSVVCPGLLVAKVRDKKKMYQPFKAKTQLIQEFDGADRLDGKGPRILVDAKDVETSTGSVSNEQEVVVDLDTTPIIYDKITSTKVIP
jgi:hypothetical protein